MSFLSAVIRNITQCSPFRPCLLPVALRVTSMREDLTKSVGTALLVTNEQVQVNFASSFGQLAQCCTQVDIPKIVIYVWLFGLTRRKNVSNPLFKYILIFLVSTDSNGDSPEVLPSHTFSLTPTIDFTSHSTADPVDIFSQSQPAVVKKEPAQSLSRVSEGQHLMDSLLESVVKCMQIQNSLHRLVLLKLRQHAAVAEGQIDVASGHNDASDFPEAHSGESTEQNPNYDPGVLLCELKGPLGALMQCTEIQRELFQRMITVNLLTTEEGSSACDNQGGITYQG